MNIMNQQMSARRIGTTVVNAVVYAVVNAVVTAPRIYSVLQKLTFLAAIIALIMSNYHQISSSSLTTGKLPVFAIAVA